MQNFNDVDVCARGDQVLPLLDIYLALALMRAQNTTARRRPLHFACRAFTTLILKDAI